MDGPVSRFASTAELLARYAATIANKANPHRDRKREITHAGWASMVNGARSKGMEVSGRSGGFEGVENVACKKGCMDCSQAFCGVGNHRLLMLLT